MEVIKTRKDLLYIVGSSLVLLSILVFFLANSAIHYFFYFHWVFLLISLWLIFTPTGIKLFGQKKTLGRVSWLTQIMLCQLCLYGLYFAFGFYLQVPSLRETFQQQIGAFGLFPWGIVAVLAYSYAKISYWHGHNAMPHQFTAPRIFTTATDRLGIVFDNTFKFVQSLSLIMTFLLIALFVASLISAKKIPLTFGLASILLFLVLITVVFSFTKSYKKIFTMLFAKPWSISVIMIVTIIGCGILIALFNFLGNLWHLPIQNPPMILYLQNFDQHQLWTIFSACWWLGFTPLVSLFIAKISAGYTCRSMTIAVFILPLIIFSLSSLNFPATTLPLMLTLGIVSFIGLTLLLINKSMLSPLVLNTLPKQGGEKFRNPEFLIRKLIQVCWVFLYLFIPIGLTALALFAFIGATPFMLFLILIALSTRLR